MIQELTIKNFLSFKDATTFSFEATDDKTLEDCQVVQVGNTRLLRFALVYGANASGKSNLLAAFEFLRRFWFERKETKEQRTNVVPFLFDKATVSEPSSFELVFFVDTVKYEYKVELDSKAILNECLSSYKTVEPTPLFKRTLNDGVSVVELDARLNVPEAALQEISLKCLPNMSFIAASDMVNYMLPEISDVRHWMHYGFAPVILPESEIFQVAQEKIHDDEDLKEHLLAFIRHADFNITEVHTEKKEIKIPNFLKTAILQNESLSKDQKDELLGEGTMNAFRTSFEHSVVNARGSETYSLAADLQSSGTRRTFGVEMAIYLALKQQRLQAIDEIESSLHPELVEFVLTQFLQEKGRSQLLITTHYDPLLDEVDDMFRKDMVWFTEKGKDGATRLYSLTDFMGLNEISSFRRFYRNGRFGALPNIG